MKGPSRTFGCLIFALVAPCVLGLIFDPFGGGKGPTTTKSFVLPTGEVVSYDTYSVTAFQDPGRDYQFYFQQTSSSPRETLGGKFPGPGVPIPMKDAKIYRFEDRIILVVDSFMFSSPDSYVFFHPMPYNERGWKILYNKRDNFRRFDHIDNDGQTLVEQGTTIGNDHLQYFVYKVTSEGELELDSERTKLANGSAPSADK